MFFAGADNRIRTGDLILTKDVLYLLSHISECFIIIAKEYRFVNWFFDFYGNNAASSSLCPPHIRYSYVLREIIHRIYTRVFAGLAVIYAYFKMKMRSRIGI